MLSEQCCYKILTKKKKLLMHMQVVHFKNSILPLPYYFIYIKTLIAFTFHAVNQFFFSPFRCGKAKKFNPQLFLSTFFLDTA